MQKHLKDEQVPMQRSSFRTATRIRKTSPRRSPQKSLVGIIGNPDEHLTRLLATQSYITEVKATFKKKPEVYSKFAYLLGHLKEPSSNTVEVIEQIVNLFEGHPHLILGLNGFLPYDCELRIQPDAVVMRVHDGHTGTERIVKRATNKASLAVDYINNVKLTYGEDSKKYREFLKVLQEYHSNERGNKATVRKMVKLLKDHPVLIQGFNAFLPDGFSIEIKKEICKIRDQTGEITSVTLNTQECALKSIK